MLKHEVADTGVQPATVVNPDTRIVRATELEQRMPSTSAAAYANSKRKVFHISWNLSAMVNIVSHYTTYPARVLIDPDSEPSCISQRLRNQWRLPSRSTNTTISGVATEASVHLSRICAVIIASLVNRGMELKTCALVLPAISRNLRSFISLSDIKGELMDSKLD